MVSNANRIFRGCCGKPMRLFDQQAGSTLDRQTLVRVLKVGSTSLIGDSRYDWVPFSSQDMEKHPFLTISSKNVRAVTDFQNTHLDLVSNLAPALLVDD